VTTAAKTTARRTPAKRSYLPADRRRAELLAVAARIVLERGWRALTMKGLADAAGVSRQLVYQHFPDLPELLVAVTEHLYERAREATVAIIEQGAAEDPGTVAQRSYELYLELPPEQRRILRALSAASASDVPDLHRAQRYVRDKILELWTPDVRERTALPPKTARALAWMMINAVWGLADLVDDGEIALPQARTLLGRFARLVAQPSNAVSSSKARANGARPRRPRRTKSKSKKGTFS